MRKTLFILSIAALFYLSACDDGFIIGSKNNNNNDDNTLSIDRSESGEIYTGPGKDYNPSFDASKRFSLYKVKYSYKMENGIAVRSCADLQFFEDQLGRRECLDQVKKNKEQDSINASQKISDEDLKALGHEGKPTQLPSRIYTEGPFRGKEAWDYKCLTQKGIKIWSKHNCQ